MKNSNKKGFTIVELVIVIAVVAILAAVLIPTFANLVEKANQSADIQAVRQMNTALAAAGNPADIDSAIDALAEAGYNSEKALIPVSKDHNFLWYEGAKQIVLVNAEGEIVFPEGVEKEDGINLGESVKYIDVAAATEEDFAAAIANGSEYIKLENDIVVSSVLNVPANSNITIDLNGKNLSAPATTRPFNLGEGSNVVIDAEGATINCGKYGLANFDSVNATLTVNGGTFTGDLDNGAFIKIRPANGDVKVTLNNVKYTDTSTDSYIVNSNGATGNVEIVVNGGSYVSALGIQAKNVTIDGATITTDAYAVIVSNSLAVKNAEITSNGRYENDLTGQGSMPAACVSVKSGGEATVTNSKLTYVTYDAAKSQGAAIVVASSGGKITVDGGSVITGTEYLDTVDNAPYQSNGKTYDTVSYIEIAGDVKVNYDSTK